MRIVNEPGGDTWICLQVPSRRDTAPDRVLVECNSGAERVELVMSPEWEAITEDEMVTAIHEGIRKAAGKD